jgi:type II secretory pathway component PulF
MGRLIYLIGFTYFAVFAIAFIMIWIIPRFQRIFDDFHATLPPITVGVINSAHTFVRFWELPFLVLLAMLAVTFYAVARYIGLLRWEPPLLRRFSLPRDQALVLRSLAQSVAQGTTISSAVSWLAKRYPKDWVRDRLRTAQTYINNGAHWCESLQASRLLPRAEAAVLKAAERVGNLSWAMNDSADRLTRRFTNRITTLISIGFPIVLLIFAAVVFVVAAGLFVPLAKLVIALSSHR